MVICMQYRVYMSSMFTSNVLCLIELVRAKVFVWIGSYGHDCPLDDASLSSATVQMPLDLKGNTCPACPIPVRLQTNIPI